MQKIFNTILAAALMLFIISCSDDNPTVPNGNVTITSISPDSVGLGDMITIYGTNFGTARDSSLVSFAGINAVDYSNWTDTEIKVKVPNGAKSGKLWVVANGEKSNEVDFTIKSEEEIESVTIGTQVWMKKNLNVSQYCNGDPIPQIKDSAEWTTLTTGAWCYYNNDPSNGEIYGKLYNWYAVNDPRGLAPEGWHVATDMEWTKLENFLGGLLIAGDKLKSTGTIESGDGLWYSPTKATNESGFSAVPGGARYFFGSFYGIGKRSHWLIASDGNVAHEYIRYLINNDSRIYTSTPSELDGLSVRCVKD